MSDNPFGGYGSDYVAGGDFYGPPDYTQYTQPSATTKDSFGLYPATTSNTWNSSPDISDESSWFARNKGWLAPGVAVGLPLTALGGSALMGTKGVPYKSQLESGAASLLSSGQQMMQPLLTGAPLPTGAEATIQGGAQGARAAILSNAAATGQLGSSSTQQALQQADIAAQQQRYTIASSMYTTGVNEVLKGDQILGAIGQQQLAQDKELQTALGGVVQMFASKDANTVDLLKGLFS